jgi:hypothetical protein
MTQPAQGPHGQRAPLKSTAYGRPEPAPVNNPQSASALLEQNEARFDQHALLPGGQAPAGRSLRQVADYLDDLDQIP